MPKQIFVVDADPTGAALLAQSLVDAPYSVSVVSSFEEVCVLAANQRPDMVITSVRLGKFNGLHLAARFRSDFPGLPMIVLGEEGELNLAADAIQLQARFVPKSTPKPEFLRYVDDLICDRNPKDLVSTRRWARRNCAFPAHMADAGGHVRDVSYGGLRLECSRKPALDAPVEIRLDTLDVTVTGTCRWFRRVADATWTGGFEIDSSATDARAWRRIVDSLAS